MKPQVFIMLLLVLGLSDCQHKAKPTMKLTFEVVPEDFERNFFYVEWEDTLGMSENNQDDRILNRRKEVWCVITDEKGNTVGDYKGLSTAQTFADFESKDTIVTLNFMIGLNLFSEKFENEKMMKRGGQMIQYYLKNELPVRFKPIKINLKNGLRKKHKVELEEK